MQKEHLQPFTTCCPVSDTLDIIGGKWKVLIIYHITKGTIRFNALRRAMPLITQRMLTLQLRELESDGIVNRKVYAEVPPKVEYTLTPLGQSLLSVIEAIHHWGEHYAQQCTKK